MNSSGIEPGGRLPLALAAAALLAVVVLWGAGTTAAEAAPEPAAGGLSSEIDSDGAGTWTPERMQAARPLDGADGGGEPTGPEAVLSRTVRFQSEKLDSTTTYPHRVHGKIFGSFPFGDFSCSGTVVSSGSGSLVVTAGHCVLDAGPRSSNEFVTDLAFAPGFDRGRTPFGVWEATHVAVAGPWTAGNSDYDTALVRFDKRSGRTLQDAVGSRGIGFGQHGGGRKLTSYGYPGSPSRYDGADLVRCVSRRTRDFVRHSRRRSLGMGCDMQQGSSGGGLVSPQGYLVSNISHSHPGLDRRTLFGPDYGGTIKRLYRTAQKNFPSIKPIRCGGKVADIIGSGRADTITGSKGKDVIATLGGKDKVRGRGGNDRICSGSGNDIVVGNGGKDRIKAGPGKDRCRGGGDRDKASSCERRKQIP